MTISPCDLSIVEFKRRLNLAGYVYIQNLPSELEALRLIKSLGDLRPQYDKQTVWNVKVRDEFINANNSLGSQEVFPHTEYYETDGDPPQYVALYCVKEADCKGGQISLVDARPFFAKLESDTLIQFEKKLYLFQSERGLMGAAIGGASIAAILSYRQDGSPIIRFNVGGIEPQAESLRKVVADYRKEFLEYYKINKIDVIQTTGSLLIWNNHYFVHARSTKFKDPSRHLKRYWIGPEISDSNEPESQKAMLFADVRGYSDIKDQTLTQKFHEKYLPEIWKNAKDISKISPLDHSITADSIYCCHNSAIELAKFSLILSKEFDKISETRIFPFALRLRIALHAGFVRIAQNNEEFKQGSIYYGMAMVAPARLEPIVRAGQTWCTKPFKQMFEGECLDSVKHKISFDDLSNQDYAKNFGMHATFRLREIASATTNQNWIDFEHLLNEMIELILVVLNIC